MHLFRTNRILTARPKRNKKLQYYIRRIKTHIKHVFWYPLYRPMEVCNVPEVAAKRNLISGNELLGNFP